MEKNGILEGTVIWLYGAPYSGKTTFTTKFSRPAVLSLDGNAKFALGEDGKPAFKSEDIYVAKTLDKLNKAYSTILAKNDQYDTLIIDPLDIIEQMVRYKVLDDAGVDDESDAGDFGKGWRLVREGTKKLLSQIVRQFEGTVVMISWEDEYTETDRLGREVSKFRPAINPKLLTDISGLTTMIVRAKIVEDKTGKHYALSIQDKATEYGGTRISLNKTLVPNNFDKFMANIKN